MADAKTAIMQPSLGCATCSKDKTMEGRPLLKCAGCHATQYCSKHCQKAGWKTHKIVCKARSSNASSSVSIGSRRERKAGEAPKESPRNVDITGWLNDRPEAEVFQLLIDSYRMRVTTENEFELTHDTNTHGDKGDPTIGFRLYLEKAENKVAVLPTWWSDGKKDACIAKGNEKDLRKALYGTMEKYDDEEDYRYDAFHMRLVKLAKAITGTDAVSDRLKAIEVLWRGKVKTDPMLGLIHRRNPELLGRLGELAEDEG